MKRRAMLQAGLVQAGLGLSPLGAAVLAGCGESGDWPEGMLPIKWDRDVCARCGMVISDRRFAAQLRGGPKKETLKFDDIGCAATFCAEKFAQHPWMRDAATRMWVAEFGSQPLRWIDPRRAHYVQGQAASPMGYNFAAHAQPQPGSVGYEQMSTTTAASWPVNCKPAPGAAS
jgi:nitrous oxide reductase accessory protein NosL